VTAGLGFLRQFDTTPILDEVRLARIERTRDAIVKILSPSRIYVFGSAVSGEILVELRTSQRTKVFWCMTRKLFLAHIRRSNCVAE
jgi:hypothetical protein